MTLALLGAGPQGVGGGGEGGPTWDPATANATAVLSNGNLTLASVSGDYTTVLATDGISTANIYFEVTPGGTQNAPSEVAVGFALGSGAFPDNSYIGGGGPPPSIGFFLDGTIYFGDSNVGSWDGAGAGSTIMLAYKGSTREVWIGVNGVWSSGDPEAGTSPVIVLDETMTGTVYPATTTTGETRPMTANFGGSAYAETPPAGFGNL